MNKNTSTDFLHFIFSKTIIKEGDIIESKPKGLFLKHGHGQLIVYEIIQRNSSNVTSILWQTRPFIDDGSSKTSYTAFLDICKIIIKSEPVSGEEPIFSGNFLFEGSLLWDSLTNLGRKFADLGGNCSLSWHLQRNQLVVKAPNGTLNVPDGVFPVMDNWDVSSSSRDIKTDSDRLFLLSNDVPILTQGFGIQSDPPGVFLQHDNGNLFLYEGEPNNESSTLLWKTDNAYVYDGDTDRTYSLLQNDCNFIIYGYQEHALPCFLWKTRGIKEYLPPVESCVLSWLPSEQRLAINSGTRYNPGPEIWTSKDFQWEPLNPLLPAWQQITVTIFSRTSAILSLCGSGLIMSIILSRWIKNKRIHSTRDRLMFFMSCLDFSASLSHAFDVMPLPSDSYGIIGAMGNQATCTTQGFFIQLGFGVPLYNCMICLYTLLIIRFKISDHIIATRIEPLMHLICLGFAIITASAGAFLQLYNSNGSFCWIEAYPMYCANTEQGYIKCLRGEQAYLFQWLFAGIVIVFSFLLIIATTGSIFYFVRQNIEKMRKRYGKQSANQLQLIEVRRQATLYVLAFALTFIWPMAAAIERQIRGVPFWLNAFQSFFFSLQGFWNIVIFLRPTFTRLNRQHKDRSCLWKIRTTILKEMNKKNLQRNNGQRNLQSGSSRKWNIFNRRSRSMAPSQQRSWRNRSSSLMSPPWRWHTSSSRHAAKTRSDANAMSSDMNVRSIRSSQIALNDERGSRIIKDYVEEMEDLKSENLASIRFHTKFTSSSTNRGDDLDQDRIERSFKLASIKLEKEQISEGLVPGRKTTKGRKKPPANKWSDRFENNSRKTRSLEMVCLRENPLSSSRRDIDHGKNERALQKASLEFGSKSETNMQPNKWNKFATNRTSYEEAERIWNKDSQRYSESLGIDCYISDDDDDDEDYIASVNLNDAELVVSTDNQAEKSGEETMLQRYATRFEGIEYFESDVEEVATAYSHQEDSIDPWGNQEVVESSAPCSSDGESGAIPPDVKSDTSDHTSTCFSDDEIQGKVKKINRMFEEFSAELKQHDDI